MQMKVLAMTSTVQRNGQGKTRRDVVLSLMKSTYGCRRRDILNNEGSVVSKIELDLTLIEVFLYIVIFMKMEQEFDLVVCKQSTYQTFVNEYNGKWVPAILDYSRRVKQKMLKKCSHMKVYTTILYRHSAIILMSLPYR